MAERVIVQLGHANSAVVLTTIKVLLYLMNYMEDRRLMDYICRKMGPPLGQCVHGPQLNLSAETYTSHIVVVRPGGPICRATEHTAHHPTKTTSAQE